MNKDEIIKLAEEHDKENQFWIEQERRIGHKMRKERTLNIGDLKEIIEWKFESYALVRAHELNLIKEINEADFERISTQVFNLSINQDFKRINLLCGFNGVGPAVASVILTFFDPKNYGVLDQHVWEEIFGIRKTSFISFDYIKFLQRLRPEAKQHSLDVRTVEKAYFRKNYRKGKTKSIKKKSLPLTSSKKIYIKDKDSLRREFFKILLNKTNEKTSLFRNISPPRALNNDNWLSAGAGITQVNFQYVILDHSARVQLAIEQKNRTNNKKIFDYLYAKQKKIEENFEAKLIWDRNNKAISSRIKYHVIEAGLVDLERWTEIQNCMVIAMVNLEKAFKKQLARAKDKALILSKRISS